MTHMECRMVFLTLFIIEPDSRSGSGLRRRNKVEQTLEMIFYTWKYSLSDIQRDRSIPNRLFFGLKSNIHSKHESLEFLISTKREFENQEKKWITFNSPIWRRPINLRNKLALWFYSNLFALRCRTLTLKLCSCQQRIPIYHSKASLSIVSFV